MNVINYNMTPSKEIVAKLYNMKHNTEAQRIEQGVSKKIRESIEEARRSENIGIRLQRLGMIVKAILPPKL